MTDANPSLEVRRRPGRPMSTEVEGRLLKAALQVLSDHGPTGMTVEKIADAAGVPRTTFYRRWNTPTEAVAAALSHAMDVANPKPPTTGDFKTDLVIVAKNFMKAMTTGHNARALSFIIAEMGFNPEARDVWLNVVRHRRLSVSATLENARDLGQVKLSVDVDFLVDILVGPIFRRMHSGEVPPDDPYVEKLVELIVSGIGISPSADKSKKKNSRKDGDGDGNKKRKK